MHKPVVLDSSVNSNKLIVWKVQMLVQDIVIIHLVDNEISKGKQKTLNCWYFYRKGQQNSKCIKINQLENIDVCTKLDGNIFNKSWEPLRNN